jgi:hypothetical protein
MTYRPPSKRFDIDQDGRVSKQDLDKLDRMLELDLREEKANTQKVMAWAAMISMVLFTIVLFSPILTDSRVRALADLLGLFYIAQAGIVGAYMGVTAWMSNRAIGSSGYSRFYQKEQSYDMSEEDSPANERISKRD